MTWRYGGQPDRPAERWNGIRNPGGQSMPAITGAMSVLGPRNAGNVRRPKSQSDEQVGTAKREGKEPDAHRRRLQSMMW